MPRGDSNAWNLLSGVGREGPKVFCKPLIVYRIHLLIPLKFLRLGRGLVQTYGQHPCRVVLIPWQRIAAVVAPVKSQSFGHGRAGSDEDGQVD